MTTINSESNSLNADRYDLPDDDWSDLRKRLDHIDDILHRIDQRTAAIEDFIDEHRPALARGLSLMDPGAGIRKILGGKRDS